MFNNEEIGMGFNSDSGAVIGTALDFDTPATQGGQEAIATAQIVTTHDSLMESIGVSTQTKGHYAFASAGLKTEYSRNSSYNSVSSFVVARMVVNNQILRGRNFRVKPFAQQLLDSNRTNEFKDAFGDSFVRALFTGGEYVAVIRITSVDTAVQTSLAIALEAEINGGLAGVSFAGKFTEANKSEHSRSEFRATFYQKGGVGKEEIGATLSIDEVKERLKTLPTAVANHPFPYEIEVVTYDTVPLIVPPREQTENFLLALADAEQQKLRFLQQRNDCQFAAEHQEFFLEPPSASDLVKAAQTFLSAANAAISHAVSLSRGEIPPRLFDITTVAPPIALPVINLRRKIGGVERNFADWYARRDEPGMLVDDRKLVNFIADQARQQVQDFFSITDPRNDPLKTERLRGSALEPVVAALTAFELPPFEPLAVTSIAHLSSMVPAEKIVDLSLAKNRTLQKIDGLEPFANLKTLDVSTNRIGEIGPVAGLVSLRKLDLARNEVVDLAPLQTCVNLEELELSGNRIASLSPLKALQKLKRLMIEGSIFLENGVTHPSENPITDASGLSDVPGIANPFLSNDRLNVRFGVLKDGPAAQFTGTAERIQRSTSFRVKLSRGAEQKEDIWRLIAVQPGEGFTGAPELDPPAGSKILTLKSRELSHLLTIVLPDDPRVTNVAATMLKGSRNATCDVLL
jgi:hypothetical protein